MVYKNQPHWLEIGQSIDTIYVMTTEKLSDSYPRFENGHFSTKAEKLV